MPTEVRSPWSLSRNEEHPRRGESPGAFSSPSNASRADSSGGHRLHNIGKSGFQPASAKRRADGDLTLQQHGFEQDLDR